MSNNRVPAILVALFVVSAALSAVLAWQQVFSTRELRRTQPALAEINARMNAAQMLLNETLEYSRKNPAIDPLLVSLRMKTNSAPAPVTKPAAR